MRPDWSEMSEEPEFGQDDDVSEMAEIAYRVILGRPIDAAARAALGGQLRSGALDRTAVVSELVASAEFREAESMTRMTRAARASGAPFLDIAVPNDSQVSERVVEVPWVLSRYLGEHRVVDVGTSNAPPVYRELLAALSVPEVISVDLVSPDERRFSWVRGDLRALPLIDASVDLMFCISTLEHVGRANERYGVTGRRDSGGDLDALIEIARVLRPGGRLLVTVPFGLREDHGWFVQYDAASWDALVEASKLRPDEEGCYLLSTQRGWQRVKRSRARRTAYSDGAVGARAVLCASLIR
jgi:SAM-dependent methyltransferase